MSKEQKQFLINAGIILVVVGVLSQVLFSFALQEYNFPLRILSIVAVWAVTCGCHVWLMKTVTEKPKAFNNVFLLQTVGKLLLFILFVALFLVFYREFKIFFTIHFFIIYIIFAIFDVYFILKFVKK